MNLDEQHIADAFRRLPTKQPLFLATVIEVTGSAYRRPGAKLLLVPDGTAVGNVSSGCVEKDLQTRIQYAPPTQPTVIEYDTTTEEDLLWGTGVGCGGVSKILLEPLLPAKRAILEQLWARIRSDHRTGWLCTAIDGDPDHTVRPGDVVAWVDTQRIGSTVSDRVADATERLLEKARSELPSFPDRNAATVVVDPQQRAGRWLVERIPPPFPLVIFGADDDVQPVASLAAQLGWEVTVVDHRSLLATPERFPNSRIVIQEPEQYVQPVAFPIPSAVLLMTHQYLRDKEILRVLTAVADRLRYCGIIGPKRRTRRIFQELTAEGVAVEALSPVLYFPTGLDIASETPMEIALSVIAEIIAVLHGRRGGHLRDRQGSIH